MKRKLLKINHEDPIEVGSVIKFKINTTRHVGEVFSIIEDRGKLGYEVILYDKRLRPMFRGDGTYKIKRVVADKCKLIDENFKFKCEQNYELGDVVCHKIVDKLRYGVIIGFTHPDGLFSTSYEKGYNGTDMIDCVEISKRGLSRKRDAEGNIKRFSTFSERLSTCEVDLWNRSGPKIVQT